MHADVRNSDDNVVTGAKSIWGVDAVVLEPLSAMSDSYNNHDSLHVISAGETFTSSFGVSVSQSGVNGL